jgi:hypothetical protein
MPFVRSLSRPFEWAFWVVLLAGVGYAWIKLEAAGISVELILSLLFVLMLARYFFAARLRRSRHREQISQQLQSEGLPRDMLRRSAADRAANGVRGRHAAPTARHRKKRGNAERRAPPLARPAPVHDAER